MSDASAPRAVPAKIYALPLNERIRWARRTAGLSHDRLAERLQRSNRGHLIKIEKGEHVPRPDLRDAIADATGVPRALFAKNGEDDEEADPVITLVNAIRALVRAEARQPASEAT